MISPTYPNLPPIRFASAATATYNSVDLKVDQVVIDSNNTITDRHDPTAASGMTYAVITDRYAKVTINPEAALVATNDHYGQFINNTESDLTIEVPVSTGELQFTVPMAQILSISESDRNGIVVDQIELGANYGVSQLQDLQIDFESSP